MFLKCLLLVDNVRLGRVLDRLTDNHRELSWHRRRPLSQTCTSAGTFVLPALQIVYRHVHFWITPSNVRWDLSFWHICFCRIRSQSNVCHQLIGLGHQIVYYYSRRLSPKHIVTKFRQTFVKSYLLVIVENWLIFAMAIVYPVWLRFYHFRRIVHKSKDPRRLDTPVGPATTAVNGWCSLHNISETNDEFVNVCGLL